MFPSSPLKILLNSQFNENEELNTYVAICFQGAGQVVAVDINPAQSYLLELKRIAIVRSGSNHLLFFVLLQLFHLQIVSSREFGEGLTQSNTGGGVKSNFWLSSSQAAI